MTTQPKKYRSMLVILMIASFLCLFNETVLSVGNNSIMAEWHLSYNIVQWTMSSFLVAMSVSVPIAAFIIHRFSTQYIVRYALLLIILGLLIDSISPSFDILICGRVLEGLGAGVLPSLLFSSALKLTKESSSGFITALCGVVIGLGPSFAPLYAGIILNSGMNWRTLFIPLVFVAIILLILSFFLVFDVSDHKNGRLDILSIILSVCGFTSLVGGINILAMGLTTWYGWILTLFGIAICGMWARRQVTLSAKNSQIQNSSSQQEKHELVPVLNISLLKIPAVGAGIALIAILQIANMALAVVYPMAINPGLTDNQLTASVMLMVPLLISQVCALCAGHFYDKYGPSWTVLGGVAVLVLGFILFAFDTADKGILYAGIAATISFIGVAFAMPTIQARMFSVVAPQQIPDVVAGAQTAMQVGGAIGTTVSMGIFSAAITAKGTELTDNYILAFGTLGCVLAIVYALSFILGIIIVRASRKK